SDDRHLRDFRRMSGLVQLFHEKPIPGPYTQASRERWLRKVLTAQKWVRNHGPAHVNSIELISPDELHEIRRIWVVEKHELEDSLPRIYEEVTGEPYAGRNPDENQIFGEEEIGVLRGLCEGDQLHFELTRELLDIEQRYRTLARRSGLYEEIERSIRRRFYSSEEDAIDRARRLATAVSASRNPVSAEKGAGASHELPLLPLGDAPALEQD